MKFFSVYFFLLFLSLSLSAQAWTFPSLKDIQDGVVRWFYSPSHKNIDGRVIEFWHHVGDSANAYEEILKDAVAQYPSAADKINEFKKIMGQVVTGAEAMSTLLRDANVTMNLEEFQNQLGVALSFVLEELKQEFSEPLPEDRTERYYQQAIKISRALNKTEDALVNVCKYWEIPETSVRTKFDDIKPHMNHSLLIVANLVNNHPILIDTLLVSALMMIIPERFILSSILRLLGFGPLGPVKDSVAASGQRFFFGAVVTEGSWFAMLQRAGMKSPEFGLVGKIFRAIKCFVSFWGSC